MAEHTGQKRAAVQFLKHGKQVNGNRAKGRETASADPAEDAHEVWVSLTSTDFCTEDTMWGQKAIATYGNVSL